MFDFQDQIRTKQQRVISEGVQFFKVKNEENCIHLLCQTLLASLPQMLNMFKRWHLGDMI